MPKQWEAWSAVSMLKGTDFMGKTLMVKEATENAASEEIAIKI
jgi:hypothetical protein